ncbi:DUF1850 domain-containing protein [Proteiniclasticum ruminis]|uniref:DUF1850 domain-containing protein n=1 Tax=Proteiniclasticum ruminis TaxID=398199 RepID=A0A1G8K261_9CLOT|nr:DUF1850 domain-containing protein [Proteiniclasticum ruminis]SDI37566.1 protein of unknown function [Proteiniclasticum ruminis]
MKRRLLPILLGLLLLMIWSSRLLTGEKTFLLKDADTGKVFLQMPVKEGEIFSITFVHSVNKSPVTDEFLVKAKGFSSYRTLFTSFGAGMESGTEEGQVLTYEEDGTMVLSGFDNHFESFQLIVGTVSDHMLKIGGEEISLRDLCGRNTSVEITIRN